MKLGSQALTDRSKDTQNRQSRLDTFLPVLRWARDYRSEDFTGDLIAGLIVAVMLIPQAMAYALLAGLPPQTGLYASILPLILYGFLGTSRALAVGPVAIVSLLVASGVSALATPGSTAYVQLALTLALLVGIIQVALAVLRLGFLVNFLSHPVLAGFTSAAAVVIAASQLKHLLGLPIPQLEFFKLLSYVVSNVADSNVVTVIISAASILLLVTFKYALPARLKARLVPARISMPLTKSAPLVAVLLGATLVWALGLDQSAGVAIVGNVPAGLPPLTLPTFDLDIWQSLLPMAAAIAFVGYLESIAVAKSLASKRRQKIDPNQELVALGIANFGATFTGGYPVTGGFSRSVVNFEAGANSGLASMITALLIGLTLLFLTPLFYFLPHAVLAAIVVVAVVGLVDIKTFLHIWHYSRSDALAYIFTFAVVLIVDVETGILVGAATAMLLFIWRSSKPHVAVVGRVANTETYRNVLRHEVQCWPNVVAVRIDESLTFANARFLEDTVLSIIADRPQVDHFVLIGTAINFIDASALQTLESLQEELHDAGVTLHLAAIKGPVLDRLRGTDLLEQVGEEHVHLSTHDAIRAIGCVLAPADPML